MREGIAATLWRGDASSEEWSRRIHHMPPPDMVPPIGASPSRQPGGRALPRGWLAEPVLHVAPPDASARFIWKQRASRFPNEARICATGVIRNTANRGRQYLRSCGVGYRRRRDGLPRTVGSATSFRLPQFRLLPSRLSIWGNPPRALRYCAWAAWRRSSCRRYSASSEATGPPCCVGDLPPRAGSGSVGACQGWRRSTWQR
jgi:hypothetical protein